MTGPADDYTDNDVDELFRWLADAMNDWTADTGQFKITADIEWAGEYNRKRHRTTTLEPMRLGVVRAAVAAGVVAQSRSAVAQRSPGWLRGGWHAQIKELTRTKAGYAAADRAGLTVTARTLLGWLSGETTPSKANRDKIERASIQLQYERAAAARSKSREAMRAAVDAFTEVVEAPYGSEIRFFNITDFEIK